MCPENTVFVKGFVTTEPEKAGEVAEASPPAAEAKAHTTYSIDMSVIKVRVIYVHYSALRYKKRILSC